MGQHSHHSWCHSFSNFNKKWICYCFGDKHNNRLYQTLIAIFHLIQSLVTHCHFSCKFEGIMNIFHLIQSLVTHCHFSCKFEGIMKNDFNPSSNWFKWLLPSSKCFDQWHARKSGLSHVAFFPITFFQHTHSKAEQNQSSDYDHHHHHDCNHYFIFNFIISSFLRLDLLFLSFSPYPPSWFSSSYPLSLIPISSLPFVKREELSLDNNSSFFNEMCMGGWNTGKEFVTNLRFETREKEVENVENESSSSKKVFSLKRIILHRLIYPRFFIPIPLVSLSLSISLKMFSLIKFFPLQFHSAHSPYIPVPPLPYISIASVSFSSDSFQTLLSVWRSLSLSLSLPLNLTNKNLVSFFFKKL